MKKQQNDGGTDFIPHGVEQNFVGERAKRKIEMIPDDGGSNSAYKRMLQRQYQQGRRTEK